MSVRYPHTLNYTVCGLLIFPPQHCTHKPQDITHESHSKVQTFDVCWSRSQKPKTMQPTSKPPNIIDVDTNRDSGIHNDGPGDDGATEPVPEDEQAELGDLESYLDSCEN